MMNKRLLYLALVVASFFWRGTTWAQDTSVFAGDAPAETIQLSPQPHTPLAVIIDPLIQDHQGDVAVSVRHLVTGEAYEVNGNRPQATASLIKLAVMIELYQQAIENRMALYRQLDLRSDDLVPGSGILTRHFSPGTRFSIRDGVRLMIALSDNTATNLIIDKIGIEAINQQMDKLGYRETRLNSKVFRPETSIDPLRSQRYGLGSTTANEMVDLLASMHAEKVVSPTACKDMLEHLSACEDNLKFPALLPAGTKVMHKTGSTDKVRTDAGIIETSQGPYALCVLTENNVDTSWSPDNSADRLCAEIAKATFDYFEGKTTPLIDNPVSEPLALGASGELVEALQRTLNAQAETTPKLAVDGQFGPATEAAVKQFQAAHGLENNGQVSPATWEALGPAQFEEQPIDQPEVINAQQLQKSSADDPFGQPAVTCKAWSIADASSGEILWSQDADQSLDMASTTKIMTAYLVMQYCQTNPTALDEEVRFSRRADKTIGSTSSLRAGEIVRVRDLLYGLMLPSGNDAAVALAEHFGLRVMHQFELAPLNIALASEETLSQPDPTSPLANNAAIVTDTPITDTAVTDTTTADTTTADTTTADTTTAEAITAETTAAEASLTDTPVTAEVVDWLPPPVVNPEAEFDLVLETIPEIKLEAEPQPAFPPLAEEQLVSPTDNPAAAPLISQVAGQGGDGYAAFVQAMNLMAEQLGMTKTHYVNPHGLTAEHHRSSCADLVKLTIAARKLPLFQQVTTTRQYGCQVKSSEGYIRYLKWENTNQLLAIDGYAGVKTGTTDAAGACLVSAGLYRDRELIVVVLGSAASASRYADTRNLFAWAWRQLHP